MNLGEKIIKIRKDNQMSQDDFAMVLNVTRQTVSNWENSKNYPDIETLVTISDTFQISLDDLLKGDKKMIDKMDIKMKNGKTFKIVTIILGILLCITGILITLNYQIKKEQTRKEEEKYHIIMENLKKLGFEKDGIGFAYMKEKNKIYKIFIGDPLPKENSITASTIPFTEEEAIYADYNGKEVRVTYLNENKVTVYCNKNGELEGENQSNNIEVYNQYKEETIGMVTKMVELYHKIYEEK